MSASARWSKDSLTTPRSRVASGICLPPQSGSIYCRQRPPDKAKIQPAADYLAIRVLCSSTACLLRGIAIETHYLLDTLFIEYVRTIHVCTYIPSMTHLTALGGHIKHIDRAETKSDF